MRKETLISFLIACAVVAGAVWIFDQSLGKNEAPHATKVQRHAVEPRNSRTPAQQQEHRIDPFSAPAHAGAGSTGKIFKCVINGKTTYSDHECATKSGQQALNLSDSRGILSPPKETLEELTAQRLAKEAAYQRQAPQQAAVLARSANSECGLLEQHIAWLDAMARQPQGAQMQDWLKQERKKARDRQFAIHC